MFERKRYTNRKILKEENNSYKEFLDKEKFTVQARLCEQSNHWAQAAILWERVGNKKNSEHCADVAARYALFQERKFEPGEIVIVKGFPVR